MKDDLVAIVGRPTVGKSTFFNRLVEGREAIVDEKSGVTRDRHYGKALWNGMEFSVVDTGGYSVNSEDVFEREIQLQVESAIEEATVILFMVDVQTGVTDLDNMVAQMLRKANKKVFLVGNKADNQTHILESSALYSLGFGEVFPVSSQSGGGTGELLDRLVKELKNTSRETEENPEIPRLAIVGKPNVGKSSLVNTLTGEYRSVVTDQAGTTRDSIDSHYRGFGFDFILVDTAGIRKKNRVREDVEYYSNLRAIRSVEHSDVSLLLIDAEDGIQRQDLNILSIIKKNNKGVVILVNKWDLIEKDNQTVKEYQRLIKERIAPFTDIPIVFTSVINKQRVFKALERAVEVYQDRRKKLKTKKLNDVMLKEVNNNPPPSFKGHHVKIKFITQLPTYAPTFAFYCNYPQAIKPPYQRFLENKLREHFRFSGVPIRMFFRKK